MALKSYRKDRDASFTNLNEKQRAEESERMKAIYSCFDSYAIDMSFMRDDFLRDLAQFCREWQPDADDA